MEAGYQIFLNSVLASTPNNADIKIALHAVLRFCKKNGRTPKISRGRDEGERVLARLLAKVEKGGQIGELSYQNSLLLKQISEYKPQHMVPRIEKLRAILRDSKEKGVGPKQHSKDRLEKRKADFLSSVLAAQKAGRLNEEEESLFSQIVTYRRKTPSQRAEILLRFVELNHRLPSLIALVPEERSLALFLTAIKRKLKRGVLEAGIATQLQPILVQCRRPTRDEKLLEIQEFRKKMKCLPRMYTNDPSEKRMAIFLNNIRTAMVRGRLTVEQKRLVLDLSKK